MPGGNAEARAYASPAIREATGEGALSGGVVGGAEFVDQVAAMVDRDPAVLLALTAPHI